MDQSAPTRIGCGCFIQGKFMQLVYEARNSSVHRLSVWKLDNATCWVVSQSQKVSILIDFDMYTDLFYDPRFTLRALKDNNVYTLQVYNKEDNSFNKLESLIIKNLISDSSLNRFGIRSLQLRNNRPFDLSKYPGIVTAVDLRRFNCFLSYDRKISFDTMSEVFFIQCKKIVKNKIIKSNVSSTGLMLLAGKWFESLKPVAIRNSIYESCLEFEDKLIKYDFVKNKMFFNGQELG